MPQQRVQVATLVLALSVGGQMPLSAQRPGSVRGIVLDAITGAPVPQVVVSIVGGTLYATTDGAGKYLIPGIPPSLVRLNAQKVGFHPMMTAFYVVQSDSLVLADFRLAPLAVNLSTLEVHGERTEQRAAIGAKVLTPKDLPGRGNILSALQGVVPGIQASGRRDDAGVRARQSHASMLFVVDGTVVTPPLTFYIDTQDVECIEVRRGYRAAQEFRPSINGPTYSGVILIWTKGSLAPQPRECASGQTQD